MVQGSEFKGSTLFSGGAFRSFCHLRRFLRRWNGDFHHPARLHGFGLYMGVGLRVQGLGFGG